MTWYVVHTQPRGEEIASQHLKRQGFDVFLPRCRKTVRHARRMSEVRAPLFPRYLFIGFDPQVQRWRSVNGTIGVSYLICDRDRPLPVDEHIIQGLMDRCDGDGCLPLLKEPAFRAGDKLRIEDGPLMESVGIFQHMDEQQRVTLLLQMLGRPVLVQVPVHAVASAN